MIELAKLNNKSKEAIFLDFCKLYPHTAIESLIGIISYMPKNERDSAIYSLELQLFMLKEGILDDRNEVKK